MNSNLKFMQTQANLLFEKTLYDYMEKLNEIYLVDRNLNKVTDWSDAREVHSRARSKMNLINKTAEKYGLKGFKVPIFVDIIGNT